jgi:Prp8 binding protein
LRARKQVNSVKENYQVLAVAFNEKADQIFVAGIENTIKVYDLRKKTILYTLDGHLDSITGLSLSPDGNHLLSNSMDNTRKLFN